MASTTHQRVQTAAVRLDDGRWRWVETGWKPRMSKSPSNIGSGIARLGVQHGYEVMISNSRGPETLAGLVQSIGCKAGTTDEAARFGDIVVVTIPLKEYRSIPAEPLSGKVVVDTMNYYPERDGQIADLDSRKSTTSELVAQHLADSAIVKAFNAIHTTDPEKDVLPPGAPNRRALPIAGNDADAKKRVSELLDQFGYDAVDAGGLSESWRFERAKPAYCIRLDCVGMKEALMAARRDVEVPEGSWRPQMK